MRRLIAVLWLAGCAQTGIPPGGPPDKEPPRLIRITPDTNAVNVRSSGIGFQFNEVVSERPRGVPTLADLFIVSPSRGATSVSWHRTHVEVRPHGGLRPNTTYTVRMLPGMVDLDNNVDSAGISLVFSTGPTIATGRISGRVFDWIAAKVVPRATVEAIALPDSARYATEADSTGLFNIRNLPPGQYLVRALVDLNKNGIVDPRELFDSLTVTLADSFRRDMLAAVRDSLGAGLATAEARDSLTVRLTLDRPLDTLFVPAKRFFTVKSSDSTVVTLDTLFTQAQVDRRAADSTRNKFIQDSVQAAFRRDSARVADSVRTAGEPRPATPPPRPTGRRPGATNAPPPVAARDTSNRIIPKPSAKIPTTVLYLKFSQALKPATTYRVTADSLPSVTGNKRTSSRVFTTPKPPKPDTGKVKPDTGRTRE